jgi:epoxyqueuosine reductase
VPHPPAVPTNHEWLITQAKQLGFDLCGVVPVAELADASRLHEWLRLGFSGEMRYLHDPRRDDPALVLPEARSVIVCALNYNQPQPYSTEVAAQSAAGTIPHGWISRYAWGDDYHAVLRQKVNALQSVLHEGQKLNALQSILHERFGADFTSLCYVDTGPITERAAAKLAGLGWLGKNTCLINRDLGSWLFLGVILTSLDFSSAADAPARDTALAPDLCGNCRLCLDACPTGALVEPYVMDARRCISYLTIELRGSIPEDLRPDMGWQVFGCDICQDVCPWNRTAPASVQSAFQPRQHLLAPELEWLLSITQEEFSRFFRHSPVKRTKWRGLIRNACIAAGNALAKAGTHNQTEESQRLRLQLASLANSDDASIAEHARWALERYAYSRPSTPDPPT